MRENNEGYEKSGNICKQILYILSGQKIDD